MAASAAVTCVGQYSACALRAARLNAQCTPLNSLGDIVVTAALVTLNMTADVDEGKKFEPKTACGAIPWTAEEEDKIKRYNIDLQLAIWDYELIEILTGAALLIGEGTWANKVVGFESPGPNADPFNGCSLEVFTKTSGSGGPCGPTSTNPPYVRHIFPRCKFRLGDHTIENEVLFANFTGWSTNNASWNYGAVTLEWDATAPLSDDAPYAQIYSATLPTTGCGIITTAS